MGRTGMKESRRTSWAGPMVAVVLLLFMAGRVHGMECLISVNSTSSDRMNPDIYGEKIVWEDWNDGAIHLYDLGTGEETKVAASPMWQTAPSISGSLVAWEEENPWSTRNITYHNLLTGTTGVLTTDGSSPAVAGQRIAWVDTALPGNLGLYDDGDRTTRALLSNGDPTDELPALSGDRIVWVNASETTISYKNITTGEEILIASGLTRRINPVISGDLIVWQDRRNGNWDLYLYNLTMGNVAPGNETLLTSGPGDHTNPAFDGIRVAWTNGSEIDVRDLAGTSSPLVVSSVDITGDTVNDLPRISSDRVVWQKYNYTTGYNTIYLATIGSSLPCPEADFTANTTSGASPLTVQFTSTSTGWPGHWLWEFGDGTTSSEENPVHTYAADGTYSVSLTVGNMGGRDYTARSDYIRVSLLPVIFFSVNQTYGIAPLAVQFTDTSSGNPTAWLWDFGDGATSTSQSPVHRFGTPGTYPVSLAATNANGTATRTVPGLIQVLNGVNLRATTDIDGLSVRAAAGRQEVSLDTNIHHDFTLDTGSPASFSFTPPAASGWQTISFFSTDGIGFTRNATTGIIAGNITSCTLESREISPTTFTSAAGNNLPISYRLRLGAYPVIAEVNATVWEGVLPADDIPFRHTLVLKSAQFSSILDMAYTLSFVTTNLTGVQGADLNLSVATPWVQMYGGGNNITAIRLGDDGIDEVLNPTATITDTVNNLDYFIVPSPSGLSRFALVSAAGSSNLIQMGTRLAAQVIQGSGGGHSSNDYPAAQVKTSQPAQPPAERTTVTYYGEGKVDTTPAGITRESVIIKSADWGAGLAIEAGTVVFDSTNQPLTLATARPVTAGSLPTMPDEAGIRFTGMAYDMGPDGATFNPPATVSFTVPDNQWDANARYAIRSYSTTTTSWDDIPTTVDSSTRIVSGKVSHLCLFGLFAFPAAGPATPTPTIRAPVEIPQVQEKPLPRTPMGTFTGMVGWIYGTLTANPQVSFTFFLTGLAGLYTYTRRSWLSRYRTWITLYLISMTGLLWALFLFTRGEPLWEPAFLFTTIAGLNLVAHIFRFDRINLTRARYGSFRSTRRW